MVSYEDNPIYKIKFGSLKSKYYHIQQLQLALGSMKDVVWVYKVGDIYKKQNFYG